MKQQKSTMKIRVKKCKFEIKMKNHPNKLEKQENIIKTKN